MAKPPVTLQRCRTANCPKRQEGPYCAKHDPNPPVVEPEPEVEAPPVEKTTSTKADKDATS